MFQWEIPISLAGLKNATAILLLTVFLFNVAGYRLFFSYADSRADDSFTSMIDKGQYNAGSLITVTVPLHMPYFSDRGTERAEGEILLNGEIYKYVSREVRNDSLILQCLPDNAKTKIAKGKWQYGNQLSGNPVPDKKIPDAGRKFISDNDYDFFDALPGSAALMPNGSRFFSSFPESVPDGPFLSLLQPPDCRIFSVC